LLAEIQPYKPRVLKTSLSDEAEAKLRSRLSKAAWTTSRGQQSRCNKRFDAEQKTAFAVIL
jgi:hypothetical protein